MNHLVVKPNRLPIILAPFQGFLVITLIGVGASARIKDFSIFVARRSCGYAYNDKGKGV